LGDVAALCLTPSASPVGRVVVAHGAGNDALFPLLDIFRALVGGGFEVFAFDLDGHGWESTTCFSADAVRTAIPAALEQARAGRPPLPIFLLGHSLGGALVLSALGASVDGVEAAVVLSAPVSVEFSLRSSAAELWRFFRRETWTQRAGYGLWGVVPAVGLLKRRAYPLRLAAEAAGSFGYVRTIQNLLADLDIARAARRIRIPVLLVYGGHDALVPPAQGDTLADAIPRAELVRLPHASHYGVPVARETPRIVAGWLAARVAELSDAEDVDRPASPGSVATDEASPRHTSPEPMDGVLPRRLAVESVSPEAGSCERVAVDAGRVETMGAR
jgi:pimeloyl-ACP methyl ester carboxylesterase